jgi:hypothetical protein
VKKFSDYLAAMAVTFWVGGLWAIGFSASVLFANLTDKQLAGMLAGKLFIFIAYVGIACGLYLLIFRLSRFGAAAMKQVFFWAVLVMLLLTLAGHFGIQPILESLKAQAMPKAVMESIFRDRFQAWHGVSSIMYLLEGLLGLVLVLKPGTR